MPFDISRRAALTGALAVPFAPAAAVVQTEAKTSGEAPTPPSDNATQLYPVGPWEKAMVKWHNPFQQFGFLNRMLAGLPKDSAGPFEIFFKAKDLGVPGIYLRPGTEVFVRTYKNPNRSLPQAAAMAPITAPKVLRVFELVSKHYNCPIGATWQFGDDNGYARLARKMAMYLTSRISSLPVETLARSITWRPDTPVSDEDRNLHDWRDAVDQYERDRIDITRASEDTEALYQSILRAGPGPLELKVRITKKVIEHKSLIS